MKIIEDPKFRQWIIDEIAKREFQERTGIHQSDLVFCLNKAALRRLTSRANTDQEILIYSLGWATQRWLTGQTEDEPELTVDDIIVTLDAIHDGYPWELKASYQSSTKPIESNVHFIRQVMAQCYVTNTTIAYLSRFELMGDYKWVFGKKEEKEVAQRPTLQTWRFEFTKDELNKNWKWLKERREQLRKILCGGLQSGDSFMKVLLPRPQALAPGMAWECDYCPFNGEECLEVKVGKDKE